MESSLDLLKLVRGGQGTNLSMMNEVGNQPNRYDLQAKQLGEFAGLMSQNQSLGAGLLQGVATGVKMNKEQKAQAQRDAHAQRMQQLLEYENNQRMKRQEIEDFVQAQAYGQAQQGGFANAMHLADKTGDTNELYRIVNGNENWKRILQRQLPEGTTLNGISVVQGPDGIKRLAPSGVTPDGQFVAGPALMTIDEGLSTFAPDVVAQRAAEKLEAARAAEKASAEVASTQALGLQRLADAGVSAPVGGATLQGLGAGPMPATVPQSSPQGVVGNGTPPAQGTVAELINSPTMGTSTPLMTSPKPAGGEKAPAGYRFKPDGTLEAIAGGPADPTKPQPVSGEVAGKLALVKQGQDAMNRTKEILFAPTPDNKLALNRGVANEVAILSSLQNIPLIGGAFPSGVSAEARELYTQLYNWNNAKLRLESGAAVPEQEVQRAVKAYMAGILDNSQSALAKLSAPEKYFNDYLSLMGRSENAAAPSAPTSGQVVNQLPQGAQQIGTSGGKPVYRTPDGKMFVGQ